MRAQGVRATEGEPNSVVVGAGQGGQGGGRAAAENTTFLIWVTYLHASYIAKSEPCCTMHMHSFWSTTVRGIIWTTLKMGSPLTLK